MYEQNIKPSGVCKHIFSELHFSLLFVNHNVSTMYHLKCKICFIVYHLNLVVVCLNVYLSVKHEL